MARERRCQRIEFKKKRFGVCKWQYRRLDCIDLYIELFILINCQFIGQCRPCRHILGYVTDILRCKWDDIRFISLEQALKIARDIKIMVPYCALLEHEIKFQNRKSIKKFINKARIEKNYFDAILDNRFFFLERIGRYLKVRTFVHSIIFNNTDAYNVNDFRNGLVFT